MPKLTARLLPHSTTTVMERDPLWRSLRPAATYLGDIRICLGKVSIYCLISNREGLGTSLEIMGLATIDPHSQREHIEIHKIPKFGVNLASFDWDTAILKRQNKQRNVWHPDAVPDSVRMALHFFVNFDIFKWLYLAYTFGSIDTNLGDFVKLGLHFVTMDRDYVDH